MARAAIEESGEGGSKGLDLISDIFFLKNSKRLHKPLLSNAKSLGHSQADWLVIALERPFELRTQEHPC